MRSIKRDKGDLEAQRDRGEITRSDYKDDRKAITDRENEIVGDFNRSWVETLRN